MNIEDLSCELRRDADRLLREGFSFEATAEALTGLGATVNADAVAKYYRSSQRVQRARIRRQLETAKELKDRLRDPRARDSAVGDAVIMAGVQQLCAQMIAVTEGSASRMRNPGATASLRGQAMVLSQEADELKVKVLEARLVVEGERRRVAAEHALQLKEMAESPGNGASLSPAMIRKIQEVYGIVSQDLSGTAGDNEAGEWLAR